MTKKIKIFLLDDRLLQKENLINLGDRALVDGFHNLLHECVDADIISGPPKPFPYITSKRFKKNATNDEILETYEYWYERIASFSQTRAVFEKKISCFTETSVILQNTLFKRIEKLIEEKYTRGIIETIMPYLLRHHYARTMINGIREADIVVFNGGGLLADHLRRYLPMYFFEIYLAKKLGKPVAVMNYTFSIKDPFNQRLATAVLRDVNIHVLRDPLSKELLICLGIPESRILVSCDSVFGIPDADSASAALFIKDENIAKGSVGIIIRGDRKVDYKKWKRVIDYIIQKYERRVFFIYTCKSHDQRVFYKLKHITSIHELSRHYDYPAVIAILHHLDLVITDRYHAAIFSILAKTPFVALESTTFKLRGLLKLFQYPLSILSLSAGSEDITAHIEYTLEHHDRLSGILADARAMLVEKARSNMQAFSSKIIKEIVYEEKK